MAVDDEKENGSKEDGGTGLVAEIEFFGNYREPNLCLPLLSILHPDDTPSNTNDQNDNGSNESKENESNAQNGPFTINKRPKDDNSPMAKPESKENENGSFPFVCRLTMDIATKQWTVEQGVKLEEVVVRDPMKLDVSRMTRDQFVSGRGQREAERARRDAEKAKKRLEAAKRAKEQREQRATASEEKQDVDGTEVFDRADQVLQDFAEMKDEFRSTINELGDLMKDELLGAHIGAMKAEEIERKKTPQQLEREQREADRARRDSERAKKRLAAKTKIAEQREADRARRDAEEKAAVDDDAANEVADVENEIAESVDTVTVDAEVADVDHDVSDHQGNDSEKAKE